MRFPFSLSPQPKSEGPQYADLYVRGTAAGIDLLLLFVILRDLFYYVAAQMGAMACKQPPQVQSWGELAAAMFAKFFSPLCLADNLFEVSVIGTLLVTSQIVLGSTPGKWLFGLKIVRHKTLEPISPWRYILRFFAYIPALLPAMLGIIWISFNKERRGWHDYIAGTVVINTHTYEWYKGQMKRGYRKLRGRDGSGAVEQPVSKPPAE